MGGPRWRARAQGKEQAEKRAEEAAGPGGRRGGEKAEAGSFLASRSAPGSVEEEGGRGSRASGGSSESPPAGAGSYRYGRRDETRGFCTAEPTGARDWVWRRAIGRAGLPTSLHRHRVSRPSWRIVMSFPCHGATAFTHTGSQGMLRETPPEPHTHGLRRVFWLSSSSSSWPRSAGRWCDAASHPGPRTLVPPPCLQSWRPTGRASAIGRACPCERNACPSEPAPCRSCRSWRSKCCISRHDLSIRLVRRWMGTRSTISLIAGGGTGLTDFMRVGTARSRPPLDGR